ncbi:response regulator [Magnetovibrio blakemorei]|uniref:Response regulatory domain-containing protein n=1 Tax=Magnetovibrio blakemorei TaxID=28181 RepID=A0A1E5QBQ1_9PROT|nr:response regulator [Magnetovibrio blakemorei]OEJ69506.1 hypothetical protein BEN30_02850 [Magnetovibrio blakemorei]
MSTILIIDDDLDICALLSVYIKHGGHKALEAHDGQEGLKQAQAANPDLIILDIKMPIMDGTVVLKSLRKMTQTAKTPVIALSAMGTSDLRDDMYSLGCNAYISKPVDIEVFLNTVKTLLPA